MMQSEPELPLFKWKRPQGGTNQRMREFNPEGSNQRILFDPREILVTEEIMHDLYRGTILDATEKVN